MQAATLLRQLANYDAEYSGLVAKRMCHGHTWSLESLVAPLQRPPLSEASVKPFDATQSKAVQGAVNVVQVPRSGAVVAKRFCAAKGPRHAQGGKGRSPRRKASKFVRHAGAVSRGSRSWKRLSRTLVPDESITVTG